MKIAVVSAWTPNYSKIAEVAVPNREAYCRRHSYEFIGAGGWAGDRTPHWARMELARKVLPEWDLLFVMDIDAAVTNPEIRLEDLATSDLVATADVNGFNCGMMLVHNTPWVRDFLDRYLAAGVRYAHHVNPEQTCLAHLLVAEPKWRWEVKPQKTMNSFPYGEYEGLDFPEGTWEPGDFILHVPALDLERRVELLSGALSEDSPG